MSGQIVNANPTVISDLPSRESGKDGVGSTSSGLSSNPLARYLGGIMWDLEASSAGVASISGGENQGSSKSDNLRYRRQQSDQRRDPFTLFSPSRFEDLLAESSTNDGDSDDRISADGDDSGSVTSAEDVGEAIDEQEIYDLIAPISDPEHPLSLGSLAVVNLQDIHIFRSPSTTTPISSSTGPNPSQISSILIEFTPTINHCSLATVIGLGIRVRLEQALPPRFRIDVHVKPGTHSTAEAVTKQLTDKERVAAALENETLMKVIRKMLATCK